MKHVLGGLATLLLTLSPGIAVAAEQAWVTRSNQHAQLLLEVEAKYSPEGASSLGIEGYDEAISDFSRDTYEPMRGDLQKVIAQLRERFDRQAYNDFLLNQGLLPPALLRQTVMEDFVGQRAARQP